MSRRRKKKRRKRREEERRKEGGAKASMPILWDYACSDNILHPTTPTKIRFLSG